MNVARFDVSELRPPKRHEDGWLRVDALLTRTGVFEYLRPDGSIRRELRLPEEVFRQDVMDSFSMVPVTVRHEGGLLDSSTVTDHAVGAVGEKLEREGDYLKGSLAVYDGRTIARMDSRELTQISCGYTCRLERKPGTWNGQPYDVIQRDIRGNHVTLTDSARGGEALQMRLDSNDTQVPLTGGADAPPPIGGSTVKKTIGGVEIEVSDVAAQAIDLELKQRKDAQDKAVERCDSAEKQLAAAKAEAEKTKAKADALAEDLEKEKKARLDAADPAKMRETIKARVALESKVKPHLDKKTAARLDSLSDKELKLALLAAKLPDVKLEGRPDAYIDGRFEALLERLDASDEGDDENESLARARQDSEDLPDDDKEEREDSSGDPWAKARAKMIQAQRDAWKAPLGKQGARQQ